MSKLLPALTVFLAFACGAQAAAPAKPGWKAFADCAAAYRANSRIADPGRTATMTADISEQADDYGAAAVKRHRGGKQGPDRQGAVAVADYLRKQTVIMSGKRRADIERIIDACPQIDE